jgi:hypothetical protein
MMRRLEIVARGLDCQPCTAQPIVDSFLLARNLSEPLLCGSRAAESGAMPHRWLETKGQNGGI